MFVGQLVSTPYGVGRIQHLREDSIVVDPSTWTMAGGQKPTFYMNPKDVSGYFKEGDSVTCTYGSGVIRSVRSEDNMYIVVLDNWRLADGKSPTLYLQDSVLSKVSTAGTLAVGEGSTNEVAPKEETAATKAAKAVEEAAKTAKYFEQCMEKVLKAKEEAAKFFKLSALQNAKNKYLEALMSMQNLGDDLNKEQRAIMFEHTVPCHNNIAVCCLRMKNYPECIGFASNGLTLIQTLEQVIPTGAVWLSLLDRGMTIDKLQKEWRKKSLYLIGKAELSRQNYEKAVSSLEAAIQLVQGDPKHASSLNEMQELLTQATKRWKDQKKKEKSTWSKAFAKNNVIDDKSLDRALTDGGPTSPTSPSKGSRGKGSNGGVVSKKGSSMGGLFTGPNSIYFMCGIGAVGLLGGLAFVLTRPKR